jgi:phosphatidylserine/phosphatidylglycerophosphate/cardiolipin synthase-like enzyme
VTERPSVFASPYFVPDEQFITALQLAALRGVEVRILIPERSDNPLVDLSAWSYIDELEKAGIAVYRYQNGFMNDGQERWISDGTFKMRRLWRLACRGFATIRPCLRSPKVTSKATRSRSSRIGSTKRAGS